MDSPCYRSTATSKLSPNRDDDDDDCCAPVIVYNDVANSTQPEQCRESTLGVGWVLDILW